MSRIRASLADSHQRRDVATLQQCEQLLQQAKQCATAMQAMAEIDNNTRRITESKYLLQRDIGPLSKEIQRILKESTTTTTTTTNRNALFSSSTNTTNENTYQAPTTASTSHHFDVESGKKHNDNDDSSMLDALIQSSDELLRESQSILYETENIGNQTIQQLSQQREQLLHTHGTMHSLQSIMASSKRIITSMSRRACRNRLVLYIVIGALLSLNLFTLYWIYVKKYAHHNKTAPDNNDININNPPSW